MTVPNNEDREALSGLIGAPHWNLLLTAEHAHTLADAILAAGFRRLPVSGDNANSLSRRLHRMSRMQSLLNPKLSMPETYRDTLREAADALSASQPREVEVADEQREKALAEWVDKNLDEFVPEPIAGGMRYSFNSGWRALAAALGGGE